MNKEIIIKEREKYNWCSWKCPYCGTDILTPSDIWRHQTKRCTTAKPTVDEYMEQQEIDEQEERIRQEPSSEGY